MQPIRPNQKAAVSMREIKRTFTYRDMNVLTLSIEYPHVSLINNAMAQMRINNRIRAQVSGYIKTVSTSLYRDAIDNYQSTQQNGYPFHAFEAVLNYTITFNMNCHLSMYRDQYEFTGGAHGNTVRSSDTFSLRSGATADSADCDLKAGGSDHAPRPCVFLKLCGADHAELQRGKLLSDVGRHCVVFPAI